MTKMKHLMLAAAIVLCCQTAFAQLAPWLLPYQAVARYSGSGVIASKAIKVRFTLKDGSSTGSTVFQETQSATTSSLGMFSVNIGSGTLTSGTAISNLTWGTSTKFLQVEIDTLNTGISYISLGTQQLWSVPYALSANSIGTLKAAGNNISINGEVISTNPYLNNFRSVAGNYGTFWRNDGGDTYFMVTASGDQYGNWNSYRPFVLNNSSGLVGLGQTLWVADNGVENGGKVGIGTKSPTTALHVQSNTYNQTASTFDGCYQSDNTSVLNIRRTDLTSRTIGFLPSCWDGANSWQAINFGYVGASSKHTTRFTNGLRYSFDGDVISTSQNTFRNINGSYGTFWRNDGSNTYFMITASGDQYGNWNSYRPLFIEHSTGTVGIGASLYVTDVNNGRSTAGFVGIGTSTPSYPLQIENSKQITWTTGGRWLVGGGVYSVDNPSTTIPSIYVKGDVLANAFIAMSDARIKNVIRVSDSKKDLTLLNKIKITDYSYIDKLSNGNREMKKVIAQEVEKILPNAVSKTTNFIPNIYTVAMESKLIAGKLNITINKPHGLKVGDKLKWIDETENQQQSIVTEITSPSSFVIDYNKDSKKSFIYGKEVNDFRSVDYEALSTLNISATQELFKMIIAQKEENEKQKSDFEARLKALEEKLNKLSAGK